jgi:N-acetylmuramoyl-L-alanine amidase
VSETISTSDLDTLARTIWGEARGEGAAGMEAVASCVMNRVYMDLGHDGRPDWWGEGVAGVCRKPWQFSCWNATDPNRRKLEAVDETDPMFRKALEIAERAIGGRLIDRTGGATHYHTKSIRPRWSEGRAPTASIGWHLFYRLEA